MSKIICCLPTCWIRRFGCFLGDVAFSIFRVRRKVTLDNLEKALKRPRSELKSLGRKIYRHLGLGTFEFFQIRKLVKRFAPPFQNDEGVKKIKGTLQQGKGVLILSAHLGNWDLLACLAAFCGLKVNVVTRVIKNTWINRFWMDARQSLGVKLLPAQGSARAILNALRRNEIVAMVMDQHDPHGAVIPFFERPARTSTALARIARLTGAPVVPAFLIRKANAFQLVVDEPLLFTATPNKQRDLLSYTRRFNEILEMHVRETPTQWLWLHRRWKCDMSGNIRQK